MRLGKQASILQAGKIYEHYKKSGRLGKNNIVEERFRHRYEVHPDFAATLSRSDLHIAGKSLKEGIVQFLEMDSSVHPYYVGTQSHPELTSKLENPAPLFVGLVEACLGKARDFLK